MTLKAADYARLPTEKPNRAARGIDRLSTRAIVALINSEDREVAPAVGRQTGAIARAADAVAKALTAGGRLYLAGAGTSGRLCVLEAAECPPTFGTPPHLVQAVMAGGRRAVFQAVEGAEDDARAGWQAAARLRSQDVLVGVAASGVTPFVKAALTRAGAKGCLTVLVTSNARSSAACADITIATQVGPEILTGSTRLKAGSAAKLVLNALTTAAMIRLHKVYDHWMVDLRPTNRKLRLRAARMVAALTGLPAARACGLLDRASGNVKTAVVMAHRGVSRRQAKRLLETARGSLRLVLEER